MTQDEPLNVALLDRCMAEVKARLAAAPSLSEAGADTTLLEMRLARAVLEGAELFGDDTGRIVAFALDALPLHRAGGASAELDGASRTHPAPGFRPMLVPSV